MMMRRRKFAVISCVVDVFVLRHRCKDSSCPVADGDPRTDRLHAGH